MVKKVKLKWHVLSQVRWFGKWRMIEGVDAGEDHCVIDPPKWVSKKGPPAQCRACTNRTRTRLVQKQREALFFDLKVEDCELAL